MQTILWQECVGCFKVNTTQHKVWLLEQGISGPAPWRGRRGGGDFLVLLGAQNENTERIYSQHLVRHVVYKKASGAEPVRGAGLPGAREERGAGEREAAGWVHFKGGGTRARASAALANIIGGARASLLGPERVLITVIKCCQAVWAVRTRLYPEAFHSSPRPTQVWPFFKRVKINK